MAGFLNPSFAEGGIINGRDLVFIGESVNFATAIANQAKSPHHVEISSDTYDNLLDDRIYAKQNGRNVDMWDNGGINWKGDDYRTKLTSWHIEI